MKFLKQKLKVKARVPINIVTRMKQYDGQRVLSSQSKKGNSGCSVTRGKIMSRAWELHRPVEIP